MLEKFLHWFQENQTLNVIITLTGFIAGIWGLYVSIKSRSKKELTYAYIDNTLITDFGSNINGLEIKYKGHPIKDLTITKLALWNSGNITINNSDIVQSDPLRIQSENGIKMLECTITQTNEPSNQLIINDIINTEKCLINFDYLDKGNGLIIQIIHTANKEDKISIQGKVKSIEKIKTIESVQSDYIFGPFKKNGISIIPEILGRIFISGFVIGMYALVVLMCSAFIDSISPINYIEMIITFLFAALFLWVSWNARFIWINPFPHNLKSFLKDK